MYEEPSATNAEQALKKQLDAIGAVDENKIEKCNVTGASAVETSRVMTKLLERDLDGIGQAFSSPPVTEAGQLGERSLAFWATEKRVEAIDPTPETNRSALYAEGGELKDLSVKVLDFIASDDDAVVRVLAQVSPGSGFKDRADDLTAIHPHLVERRKEIVRKELMTEAQIDRVGELAPVLLDPKAGKPQELLDARLLRDKAWTHFLAAYNEIRRHVAFLHFYDQEKLDEYPSVYRRGTPASKK